jgi:hypothetical protein
MDDGYVSAEDQVAAERQMPDQPEPDQPEPVDDVAYDPPFNRTAPLSLDGFLKELKDAAKRGPGRPRKRRGEAAHEFNELALMTPEQRTARLTKITAKLTVAEDERASLEVRRSEVDVLDDAALDGYHADLARAEATCVTLRMAADKLGEAIQCIEASEAARAFAARACRTLAESAETYAADLQKLHDLTAKITALGPCLEKARNAIDHTNAQARERGRSDLLLNTERLRSLVNQEIGSPVPDTSPIEIERMGESDEEWHARVLRTLGERAGGVYHSEYSGASASVKSREVQSRLRRAKEIFVERGEDEDAAAHETRLWASIAWRFNCHKAVGEDKADYDARLRDVLARELKIERKGERDEAYQLRVSNAHAQRLRTMERQDPLVESARAAARVIEAHCVSPAMGEVHRHRERVQRFVRWGDSQVRPVTEPVLVRR